MFKLEDGEVKLTKPFPENMTAKEALELSIQKWGFILLERLAGNRVTFNGGFETCALCRLYNSRYDCSWRCPVVMKTRHTGCAETPYYDAIAYYELTPVYKEYMFLRSLRKYV